MAIDQYCPNDGKPHVVMIPYPLQGHVIPLMRLAKLLAGREFGVTFVLNELSRERMEAVTVAELKEMGIWVVGIWDGLKEKAEAGEIREPKDALLCLPFLDRSFEAMVGEMMVGSKIVCIISDAYLPGTQETASRWGIPRVCFWPNSLATLACSLSLPQILQAVASDPSLLDPFKPPVYLSDKARIMDCIPGLPQLDMRNLPFHTMGYEYNQSWLRRNLETQIACLSKSLCIICNSFLDLERELHEHLQAQLPTIPILTMGPLLPPGFLGSRQDPLQQGDAMGVRFLDEEEDCIPWLDSQKPESVLFVSMGSLIRLDEVEFQKIALALKASKQPFLWVLGPSSLNKSPLIPPDLENQGKITRWVPQSRVLSHKAIGGFLTHCGWNSTLESLSMGVPMIGWPRMMDQMTNSWFVVEKWKVGLKLELEEVNEVGHNIGAERCIQRLMQAEEGHVLRARARGFCSNARAALASIPSMLDVLASIILSSSSTANCESKV